MNNIDSRKFIWIIKFIGIFQIITVFLLLGLHKQKNEKKKTPINS